jgi:ClpP class serine protease
VVGRKTVAASRAAKAMRLNTFARKHGITPEQARQLIKEHGNSRDVLDREAEKLKRMAG